MIGEQTNSVHLKNDSSIFQHGTTVQFVIQVSRLVSHRGEQ